MRAAQTIFCAIGKSRSRQRVKQVTLGLHWSARGRKSALPRAPSRLGRRFSGRASIRAGGILVRIDALARVFLFCFFVRFARSPGTRPVSSVPRNGRNSFTGASYESLVPIAIEGRSKPLLIPSRRKFNSASFLANPRPGDYVKRGERNSADAHYRANLCGNRRRIDP